MVRVKGGEWGHVSVVKAPAKHGMAWHVQCCHCGKVFQGNALRIRSHLLGHPEKVSGCPACPPEAREELRRSYLAKSQQQQGEEERRRKQQQQQKKKKMKMMRQSKRRARSSHENSAPPTSQELKEEEVEGERLSVQQAFRSMMVLASGGWPTDLAPLKAKMPNGDVADLEFFLDGFGIRAETITKIKEMGFTGKTFMSNVDELLPLLDSIKQHCHLTLGEEWGIKGAAKKWQKEHGIVKSQPEIDKWPDSENKAAAPPGWKEVVLNLRMHRAPLTFLSQTALLPSFKKLNLHSAQANLCEVDGYICKIQDPV